MMDPGVARRGAGNLSIMLGGRLATQIVLVVSAFVIPRVLGAENYGLYAAVMAVIAIAQTVSSCGLPMVEVRETWHTVVSRRRRDEIE